MPELPEVEVICHGLRPHLVDRTITAFCDSGKRLRHPIPTDSLRQNLINHRIVSVERRAKYLQVGLANGTMIIIHLGMTGNLGIFHPDQKQAKHDHAIWSLDNNTELRYNDSRRFGSILLLSAEEAPIRETTIFKTTGPEPFSDAFSGKYLYRMAKNKNLPVKVFIMTNQVVAGIGNIYANESLFADGIRPSRRVKDISVKRWDLLVRQMRRVLRHAIACGGSTISDFVNAGQEKGYFQMNFTVYGRVGERCPNCSSEIQKTTIAGRASYFCPACQK